MKTPHISAPEPRPARTLVRTEVGFYAVGQGISLDKGKPLAVELRGNQGRDLCDQPRAPTP